ncbi:MAG: Ig-like domain-containing protein [Bacteroidaceae bacterium]|nr:Ig-like domain-containing protein [Bacteroidaceae bacterium]
MRKILFFCVFFAKLAMTTTLHAQIISGDLNHNGDLDVEDITLLINGYLTGEKVLINVQGSMDNGHEYVDLGLSVMWATMNVGANTPEEYGDYFAWGEVTPKDTYAWKTYNHCEGTYKTLTKYNYDSSKGTVDNKTVLDYVDDAARVNWGGGWRMPTYEELNELFSACRWDWTVQNGMRIMKVTGPNGNFIILPTAGYFSAGSGSVSKEDSDGRYWSSSLNMDMSQQAWDLNFTWEQGQNMHWRHDARSSGYSIRAVTYGFLSQLHKVSLSETSLEMNPNDTVQLTAKTVSYSSRYIGEVKWISSDENIVTVNNGLVTAKSCGVATVMVEVAGATATCEVTVVQEAVDLGLPSGLKWATTNIGANSPEEYGDYFAWGETEPKETYNWETYKWCNGSYNTLTKYCCDSDYGIVDNKTVLELELEDDAAHAKLGGAWRMPTHEEFAELRKECTWTWTTQNGVNGRKGIGPNGNSIFLPAAGHRDGSSLSNEGRGGYFWSSSLNAWDGCHVYYESFTATLVGWGEGDRCSVCSVRAVCP